MFSRRSGITPVLAMLAVLALIVSACTAVPGVPGDQTGAEDPDGHLVTNQGAEPDTIDPHKASFVGEIAVINSVFEGLMTLDPETLKPIPGAAAAEPEVSADGLTYTYTLRDDLKYSDGSPLTANDFVYGFTRTCDPRTEGVYAFVLYIIVGCDDWNHMDPSTATPAELEAAKAELGVRALDDKRIEFTLIEPAAYFPSITYMWVGMPARQSDVERGGDRWTEPATYIGNGPFKLVEWKHNQEMVFERNENYRLPVKLARWTRVQIIEGAVAFAAYRGDELDAVGVAAEDLRVVEGDPELSAQLIEGGGSCTFYYGFNIAKPPFDDPKVRLAFAKSFDREAYINDVQKIGKAATGFIPEGFPGNDPTDDVQTFDVAAAKQLLAESTYANSPELNSIKFTYSASARSKTRVEWAQQQWKTNLGIEVQPDPVESTAYTQLVKQPETTPQLFVLGWCADFPDEQNWHTTVWISGDGISAGRTSYENPEFDTLVRNADKDTDSEKRAADYLRAGKILSQDAPAAWLYYDSTKFLLKPYVKGVTTSAIDSVLGQFKMNEIFMTTDAPDRS
ncbi:MAG: peptide ABC transporter substrate-binding protein [Candidatus Limnocylindria bacterium]